jgi:hypothetical protein
MDDIISRYGSLAKKTAVFPGKYCRDSTEENAWNHEAKKAFSEGFHILEM